MATAPRALWVALILFTSAIAAANPAYASIIVGPDLTSIGAGAGVTSWGIQFRANQNATLTGFDFVGHPTSPSYFSGTITLKDVTAPATLFTDVNNPFSSAVETFSGLDIDLSAGHDYQLINTNTTALYDNARYLQAYGLFPNANADISVTTGVVNNSTVGFAATNGWWGFRNLVTEPMATPPANQVPEPAACALWAILGVAGVAFWRRRRAPAA